MFDQICGQGNSPRERRAIRILHWMLVARRPLRRSELSWAISLDQHNPRVSKSTRPLVDILELCYPILEAGNGEDADVSFIHFTAYE